MGTNVSTMTRNKNGASGFSLDIQAIRERARRHIEAGAVTATSDTDRATALRLLNEALATEMVCVLRYKRHAFMAKGVNSAPIAAEFQAHAAEEQAHADRIAERIVQLGGAPDFAPQGLADRSHAQYVEGDSLLDMIREDLIAERIAIDSYRMLIQWFAGRDSTTRLMLEGILAAEEAHADELADLLPSG